MAAKQSITVDKLLRIPFSRFIMEHKIRIISEGKPRPFVNVSVKDKMGVVKQFFNFSLYDEIEWLTGCNKRNKLFCWPCLLFAKQSGIWNCVGVSDATCFIEKISEHEKTLAHRSAIVKFEIFNAERNSKSGIIAKKESEIKSREIKKRLIDICCVAIRQQHFNKYHKYSNILDIEKCTKIMEFIRDHDRLKMSISDDVITLIKTSPEIINSVVCAFHMVIKSIISKELQACAYVSIILNQHSDRRTKPQVSTILRYARNGKVYERFVGFTNMAATLTIDSVHEHILHIIEEYKISGKVRAIALDGAIMHNTDMVIFLDKITKILPQCCIVPWHLHDIDYILQQCLYSISICGQFFEMLASMQIYFQKNSDIFLDLIHENNLALTLVPFKSGLFSECNENRFASSEFITTVKKQRQSFIEFFDLIINTCQKWDSDSLAKVFGFREYLQKFQTIFLLEVFSRIFDSISNINIVLKEDKYDFEKNSLYQLVTNLIQMQVLANRELWTSVEKEIEINSTITEQHKTKRHFYMSLFNTITKLAIQNINLRFKSLDKLKFCNMFNCVESIKLEDVMLWLQSLNAVYKQDFNDTVIYSELKVLWKYYSFSIKSVNDFYKFVMESNLYQTFNALTDIAELILIMPFKAVPGINNVSKLQIIEKWSGDVKCKYSCSIFCIEPDIFEDAQKMSTFHEEVMEYFKLT